jgi:hypothetical protein
MVRTFALIFGIVYLLAGILAFISSLITPMASMSNLIVDPIEGKTMSFWLVSVLRLGCIGIGILGIVSSRSYKEATIFGCTVGVLYALIGLINFIPSLNATFGIAPFFAQGAWLHAIAGFTAAYFGFVVSEPDTRRLDTRSAPKPQVRRRRA